jgi:hypothetical protein
VHTCREWQCCRYACIHLLGGPATSRHAKETPRCRAAGAHVRPPAVARTARHAAARVWRQLHLGAALATKQKLSLSANVWSESRDSASVAPLHCSRSTPAGSITGTSQRDQKSGTLNRLRAGRENRERPVKKPPPLGRPPDNDQARPVSLRAGGKR